MAIVKVIKTDSAVWKFEAGNDHGSGGFLSPPGHPTLTMSVMEYRSMRSREPQSIMSVESVAKGEDGWIPTPVVAYAQEVLDKAATEASERWIRQVYGYFKSMYTPESGSTNASDLIVSRDGTLPPERHAAVAFIRRYFPAHAPRTDLIANPGKGYGSYPCVHCGQTVQYEARFDAYAIVNPPKPNELGQVPWRYITECANNPTGHDINDTEETPR